MSLITVARVGIYSIDAAHRRWFASETWAADDAVPEFVINTVSTVMMPYLRLPFGTAAGAPQYSAAVRFYQQIYPPNGVHFYAVGMNPPVGPRLNDSAPEAAFRLQRVGVAGSGAPPGRICYPILSDASFTDLPHRRRVNLSVLAPQLASAWSSRPYHITTFGYTMHLALWHRRSLSWTQVESHQLLQNPVRIWERWRRYPNEGHTLSEDARWSPPELAS